MASDTERTIRAVLGEDRVISVNAYTKTNFDGMEVLRVIVVYDALRAPTVAEMTRVVDALVAEMPDMDAPFPVVDFQADTDHEPVAAE